MIWKDLLEAPLADFGSFGDPEIAGSLRTDDLRALRNPKWHEKVYRLFHKTPYDFNVYVYNAPDAMAPIERREGKPVKINDIANLGDYVGIQPLQVIARLIGRVPPNAENSITVVLVQNEGEERVSLTPWILAHRIVHAMFYAAQTNPVRGMRPGQDLKISSAVQDIFTTFNSMFNRVEKILDRSMYHHGNWMHNSMSVLERINEFSKLIAKFRSGQMGKLANPGEFIIEAVTQYLVQGKVSFQRPTLDDAGRTSPLDPAIDADLLAIARGREGQYLSREDFVRTVLSTRHRIKNPPRKLDPNRVSYTAFDQDGRAFASFGTDRVERYRSQGYRVERVPPPSQQAIARYETYIRRVQELESLYDKWESDGLLRHSQTNTDMLDEMLDRFELQFNQHIAAMLDACVGKAVIL
jgi:hypothetical protein